MGSIYQSNLAFAAADRKADAPRCASLEAGPTSPRTR
jgi:hypothetical protein